MKMKNILIRQTFLYLEKTTVPVLQVKNITIPTIVIQNDHYLLDFLVNLLGKSRKNARLFYRNIIMMSKCIMWQYQSRFIIASLSNKSCHIFCFFFYNTGEVYGRHLDCDAVQIQSKHQMIRDQRKGFHCCRPETAT